MSSLIAHMTPLDLPVALFALAVGFAAGAASMHLWASRRTR